MKEFDATLRRLTRPSRSHEETLVLIASAQAGDRRAREELIRSNLRFVAKAVMRARYLVQRSEEDALQLGMMALNKAIDRFQPERGFKFLTYANWWIKQLIGREGRELNALVHVPIYRGDAGVVTQVSGNVSLDAPLGDEEDSATRLDFLPSEAASPEDAAVSTDAARVLHELLQKLKPQQREVIERRFLRHQSLQEVGDHFKVSRERIRQIETVALSRLAKAAGSSTSPAAILATFRKYEPPSQPQRSSAMPEHENMEQAQAAAAPSEPEAAPAPVIEPSKPATSSRKKRRAVDGRAPRPDLDDTRWLFLPEKTLRELLDEIFAKCLDRNGHLVPLVAEELEIEEWDLASFVDQGVGSATISELLAGTLEPAELSDALLIRCIQEARRRNEEARARLNAFDDAFNNGSSAP